MWNRGGRTALSVPNSRYGLCGRCLIYTEEQKSGAVGHPAFLLFCAFVGCDGCTFELCESLADHCISVSVLLTIVYISVLLIAAYLVKCRVSVFWSPCVCLVDHRVAILLIILYLSWLPRVCLVDHRMSTLLIIVYLVDRLCLSSWSLCVCPHNHLVSVLITVLSFLLITVFHVSRYSAIQSNKTSPSLIVRTVSVDNQGRGVL